MTTYAYFDGPVFIGEYDEQELPRSAQRQDTRGWLSRLLEATPAEQRAAGYYQVIETPRPDDTDTLTWDRKLDIASGAVVSYWEGRPKTDVERAADNAATIHHDTTLDIDRIRQTVDSIRTIINTPNATINASPAPAIKAMARDCLDIAHTAIRLARLTTGTTNTTTTDYGTGTTTLTHEWMIVL